jgi:toll-interacting protein
MFLHSIDMNDVSLKVLIGELPADFLRILVPSPHPQQQVTGQYVVDPSTVAQAQFFNQGPYVQVLLSCLMQSSHALPFQGYYSFVPPNTRGRVSITIVEAKLAKNYGLVRMDPYCRVRVGNTVFETPSNVSGGKAPKWNRIVHAYLPEGVESVYLQIYDEVSQASTMQCEC